MAKTLNIDDQLYQKLVAFYTDSYQLPPLAAKIYAYLTFDFDMHGITFEECVEVFKASKSSVSSNLQLLQKGDYLIAVSKMEERKRFFIINPDYVKIRFSHLVEKLGNEMSILEDLKTFRLAQQQDENNKIYINKIDIYIHLLKTSITNFTDTLKKLYH